VVTFKFVRWCEEGLCAIFRDEVTGREFVVPFSRLIPHPVCEFLKHPDIEDPNELARRCAEESSIFGIAIFRHYLHLLKEGNLMKRELEKEYLFPETVDFSCVREEILRGTPTDEAIRKCST